MMKVGQTISKYALDLNMAKSATNKRFEMSVCLTVSTLQLICAWKDEGKEVFQRHQPFELARDEDESTATHVFDTLLAKCESLQVSNEGTHALAQVQKQMTCLITLEYCSYD